IASDLRLQQLAMNIDHAPVDGPLHFLLYLAEKCFHFLNGRCDYHKCPFAGLEPIALAAFEYGHRRIAAEALMNAAHALARFFQRTAAGQRNPDCQHTDMHGSHLWDESQYEI